MCFTQHVDLEELDHATIIKYICLTSIAEGHGAPEDVNLVDIAKLSFVQTSKTGSKPEKFSLNRGLKVFKVKGHAAVKSELTQIHNREVFIPMLRKHLTKEQIMNALECHLFLEEKKTKEVKGRIVGGGDKQRSYVSKQEASSPTSHTESVFCTFGIDAEEERDVAVVDIPNAFVQTDLAVDGKPVFVLMAIRGRLADTLVSIAPEVYGPYVAKDKK